MIINQNKLISVLGDELILVMNLFNFIVHYLDESLYQITYSYLG